MDSNHRGPEGQQGYSLPVSTAHATSQIQTKISKISFLWTLRDLNPLPEQCHCSVQPITPKAHGAEGGN